MALKERKLPRRQQRRKAKIATAARTTGYIISSDSLVKGKDEQVTRSCLANASTLQIIDRVFAPNRMKHKIFLQSLYVLSRPLAGALDEKTALQAWT